MTQDLLQVPAQREECLEGAFGVRAVLDEEVDVAVFGIEVIRQR